MKVLCISGAFPPMPSGESTNAFYLSRHLADRGIDVHVLTTKGCATANHPGVTVHPIMRNWSWSEAPRLAKFLKHAAPDVVFMLYLGWIYNYQFMMTFAPTISKRLLPHVPFVTRFENAMGADPRHTSLLARAIRKGMARWDAGRNVDYCFGTLLRDSDRIVVLSDYHRAILSEICSGVTSKSVLIPPPPNMRMCSENNGAARQRGREMLGINPHDFLIAYIGYIHAGKGLETLLKAFQIVTARKPHVQLVLIGGAIAAQSDNSPSYIQEIQAFSKKLGIDQRVTWTGSYSWDNDEASVYLRAADVCVLPFNTGVHLNNSSFASATSHGLPMITTRSEIPDQPFVDQENVFLCPPKNPEAMAAAIEKVIDNADLRQRLRLGALQLAQEWFSWESAIDRTMATFQ
jgi:glycosyltransferase involved in cell wall biosynthesis